MKKRFLLSYGVLCLFFISSLKAQNASLWTKSSDKQVPLRPHNERLIIPQTYEVWKVNFEALKQQLDKAPMEYNSSPTAIFVTLPMPDGKLINFQVYESPVAHPLLMAKYPTFKTFSGFGGRNKEYAGRFDYTIDGFRATIDTPEGEVYIDPYATDINDYVIVYYTKNYQRQGMTAPLRCGTEDTNGHSHLVPTAGERTSYRNMANEKVRVRTFRLAMGGTAEFTNNTGGKEKALARIVAIVNRTTKITMKEGAVKFELIANTDTLIWTNPSTDPFPQPDKGKIVVGQTHAAIVARIGVNAFDIGHVMTRSCTDGVGGVAGGSVCTPTNKGAGVTCDNGSVDQISINIVSHEMGGHQFTGSHTMSNCAGSEDQVGSSSRIEPGSGSTVMSYDGSCGADNITGTYWKSEGFFSVGTIGQIQRHITSSTCGATTEIQNHYPALTILSQQKGLVIPRFTAFELKANATDLDGDNLRYSWEQSDIGSYIALGRQNLESNNFRVFDPVASPNRTFPRLDNIIKNKLTKDELYPDSSRLYTFVCTVRDNNILGGGVVIDSVLFRSTHTAGPFVVTYPNAATDSLVSGEYNIIKWNVANTNNNLVNCQNVDILLSTDGGYTYPITLLSKTANDGEEGVILPANLNSSLARIRINASYNIFFDISNRDFPIKNTSRVGYTVAFNSEKSKICLPDKIDFNIQSASLGNYDKDIQLSVDGLPQGAVASFEKTEIAPGGATKLTIDFSNVNFQGNINIRLRAISGTDTTYRITPINTVSADFSAFTLTTPSNGATAVNLLTPFEWTLSPNASNYDIQLATSPSFEAGTILYSASNLKIDEIKTPVLLTENKLYFWRMRAKNECKDGNWSVASPFHTLLQACQEFSNNTLYNIPASQPTTINSEINVTESGVISDVNVTTIKGKHANFGHLEIRLSNDNGKVALLSDKRCLFVGGNSLLLRYDDEATQGNNCDKSLNAGIPYRPETPLSVFDGENTKGKWQLQVKDVASGDGGNIEEWKIRFCAAKAVNAPILVKNDTLKVRPNKGFFISDELLLATDDKATPQQLVYTLITLPQFGTLERWGGGNLQLGSTFTQAELNQKATIRYVHGNNSQKNDFYLFIITDGEGGFLGTLRYNILIDENAQLSNTQNPILANSIKVYPNPSNHLLNVSSLNNYDFDTKIQLFNFNGQLMVENTIPTGSYTSQLETAVLPDGIYLLKISNLEGFATKRIVIQH
jgi:subtilisin-like proprotein convertase family protein